MRRRSGLEGRGLSASAGWAVACAFAALAAFLAGWLAGGAGIDLPWAPSWDLRLAFELDGLAALYGILAAGIGLLVFVYASAYVPRHLAHQARPRREEARLHAAMVLFLISMLGLTTAQDLILLFVFWDLTAVASWLLIGFDRHDREARLSALMALMVTVVSAVLMLIGILMLRVEYATTQLPELFAIARQSTTVTVAVALIVVAALAKSAQVPFHFWLPRAMAAPTPVSAYLHSAAMVAAGVFLLSRIHPLIALDGALLDALLVIGFASMALGGVLALAADGLKRLLAYSTISQYGYVVTMLGVGGTAGAAAACFYVLAHALAKSALFMTAGAVTEATGAKALSGLGGLARGMPLLALSSGAAVASIAALPLTIGFFKDELFFKAALEHGSLTAVLAVAGGIVVAPFAALAQDAAAVTSGAALKLEAAYHLDARSENLMALAAYALGAFVLVVRGVLSKPLAIVEWVGSHFGPERAYSASLRGLNRLSNRLHDIEVRDLRTRVAAVIVPGAALVAVGVVLTPTEGSYQVGQIVAGDTPLIAALAVCALAAVAVTAPRNHLALALMLSAVGFALATAYSLLGAPDVALVAVLIETIFALLFVGVFALLPADVLRREARLRPHRSRQIRDAGIAITSGLVTTLVVWAAFSRPVPSTGMADRHLALADDAHGKDVVTVILADFRGLDTLVEITVVGVAMVGVTALLASRRQA